MKAENERLVQKPAGGQRGGEKHRAVPRIRAAFLRRLTRAPALTTGFGMTGRQLRTRLVRLFDTHPKRRGRMVSVLLCAAAVLVCGLVACGAAFGPEERGAASSAVSVVTPDPAEEAPWPNVYYTATPVGERDAENTGQPAV